MRENTEFEKALNSTCTRLRLDYNRFRPHSSLGDLTREEYAERAAA